MAYTSCIIDAEFAAASIREDLTEADFNRSVLWHVLAGGSLGIWTRGYKTATLAVETRVVAFYSTSNYRNVRTDKSVTSCWVRTTERARFCCTCRCNHCAECQCCCEMCGDCDECACCCAHSDKEG
jgi:hypothetical protein